MLIVCLFNTISETKAESYEYGSSSYHLTHENSNSVNTLMLILTAPVDLTLECGDVSNSGIINNWLTSSITSTAPGCNDFAPIVVTNDFVSAPSSCDPTINTVTVTFTATNECGNIATDSAIITLVDTQSPVITYQPQDVYLECNSPTFVADSTFWVDKFGLGTAVDNCGIPTASFLAVPVTSLCGGTSATQFSFVATDDCGNSITAFANLFVLDLTAPTLTLPTAPNTIACDAIGTSLADWLASASATDDCDGTASVTSTLISKIESCDGDMHTNIASTYLFLATDECGNIS